MLPMKLHNHHLPLNNHKVPDKPRFIISIKFTFIEQNFLRAVHLNSGIVLSQRVICIKQNAPVMPVVNISCRLKSTCSYLKMSFNDNGFLANSVTFQTNSRTTSKSTTSSTLHSLESVVEVQMEVEVVRFH
jgi:hypothetical protein